MKTSTLHEPAATDASALPPIYGLLAEFETPEALLSAAARARDEGYRKMDAYSPFSVHGLSEALGRSPTRLPWIILGGATVGGMTGYGMQYFASVVHWPLNIAGRPLHSWPAFIPVTFELTVLFASFTALIAMIALNRLPQPYHPVFNVPRFELASTERFFLCIEASDPHFDREKTWRFLEQLDACEVSMVEP